MNKITSFLFSMLFTGVLLVVFAVSIGYATFIENDFGTTTAKILVYDATWFEGLLVLLSINLIGSIFVNNLIGKKQWPVFLFHIAFVVILIGAAITRYYGFEGSMHIREGSSSDFILSDATYITVEATDGNANQQVETEVKFSPYTANSYSENLDINGKTIHVKNLQYIPSAVESVVIDPMGEPIVSLLAVGSSMQRVDFNLRKGEVKQLAGKTIGFETDNAQNDINLKLSNGELIISANDSLVISGMMNTQPEVIPAGNETVVNTQKVYTLGI